MLDEISTKEKSWLACILSWIDLQLERKSIGPSSFPPFAEMTLLAPQKSILLGCSLCFLE